MLFQLQHLHLQCLHLRVKFMGYIVAQQLLNDY